MKSYHEASTKTAGLFTYSKKKLKDARRLNQALFTAFSRLKDTEVSHRTHLFHGRYENTYIELDKLPELKPIHDAAKQEAISILGTPKLKTGFWFNEMPPGTVTSRHCHDDFDELLSGVYYIRVPENSGDLIIHSDDEIFRITPEEGLFVFFPPDMDHEVTENLSGETRLSVAFNFGPDEA